MAYTVLSQKQLPNGTYDYIVQIPDRLYFNSKVDLNTSAKVTAAVDLLLIKRDKARNKMIAIVQQIIEAKRNGLT